MAAKKNSRKKSAKSGKVAGKKLPDKSTRKAKSVSRSANKAAQKKAPSKTKRKSKNTIGGKKASATAQADRKRPLKAKSASWRALPVAGSAGQSGDLQGLSNVERADSESIDELIEEGNAFEAAVVTGVEEAEDRGAREVHTREVPEDEVPGEYLDEDK